MKSSDTIEAVAGQGLVGDRYAQGTGSFQKGESQPSEQVTLIEQESLDAVARDDDLEVTHAMTRRNLLTRGVPLNHLVGRQFTIGDVLLRGIELCEPCGHLEKLTVKGICKKLVHRGGLRAEVLRGGTLQTGMPIGPAN